ncbi:hypothetical protein KDL01_35325 [Actinospica durhamensis]|uniref:Uncharacterized protein n=1 Tax=Actinospica durhamensis TaxID=1508375 RepID=A0A941EY52_9ACTN|nr:hypothetical protein [Actinospica durhamensis]MBR7838593.1 hypothetical protein [Actinospica durhamensis]
MNNDVHDPDDADDSGPETDLDLDFTSAETVEAPTAHRHRRWWLPAAALVSVLAAVAGGIYAAHWSSQRHQQALQQQVSDLTEVVAHKAGPGLDTAFDFSADAKDGRLTLSSPTTFYVACTAGRAVIGPFTNPCDGKLAVYGPYGSAGTVLHLSLPAAPWALIARPQDQGLVPTPGASPAATGER